jgi:hypothetical protein
MLASNMKVFNFKINNWGPVSANFLNRDIHDFIGAMDYIRKLPYKRNKNKVEITCVFDEHCGTCSTKHAALYQLAQENGEYEVKLYLSIYKMNARNTYKVKDILEKNGLDYIPEAHNYIKINNEIVDCTGPGFNPSNYKKDILEEIQIESYQITDFKVQHHKSFLIDWLNQNPEIHISIDKLWKIREDCIRALSGE